MIKGPLLPALPLLPLALETGPQVLGGLGMPSITALPDYLSEVQCQLTVFPSYYYYFLIHKLRNVKKSSKVQVLPFPLSIEEVNEV